MASKIPSDLTSYDFLKTAAIVLMVIDHLGYYFFPDYPVLRVLGRLCVPIWFFLIGYAQSRDLRPRLWMAWAVLTLSDVVIGHYLMAFNILLTIILIRLSIDRMMLFARRGMESFVIVMFFLLILMLPTTFLFEYGTQGFILAIFGYLMRHKDLLGYSSRFLQGFALLVLLSFAYPQMLLHGFDVFHGILLVAGTSLILWWLYRFRPVVYTEGVRYCPPFLHPVFRFLGRHTLAVYVGHLLLFKALVLMGPDPRFVLFQWDVSPFFLGG